LWKDIVMKKILKKTTKWKCFAKDSHTHTHTYAQNTERKYIFMPSKTCTDKEITFNGKNRIFIIKLEILYSKFSKSNLLKIQTLRQY